jgi:hypothetical protein
VTADFYIFLIGILMLVASALVLRRSARLRMDAVARWSEEPLSVLQDENCKFLELGVRIFALEDYEFIALETPSEFQRVFRAERTALALEWLDQVRRGVGRLIRTHLRTARGSANLRPADEVKLGFEFLSFQLTIGILYCAVWLRGPLHAARLVGFCIKLAEGFKSLTTGALPVAGSMAAEFINDGSSHGGRKE